MNLLCHYNGVSPPFNVYFYSMFCNNYICTSKIFMVKFNVLLSQYKF